MAVVHVKNIHNHKIKVRFRNEPLPPYFDGYVDTLSGDIVDPVSNVDTFLQSIKDEVDAKVGNMSEMINKSQTDLSEKTGQLNDFLEKAQSDFDTSKTSVTEVLNSLIKTINENNNKILGYLFQSSQFGGNKEFTVNNGTEITADTVKYIKRIRYDVTYAYSGYYSLEFNGGKTNYQPDGWSLPSDISITDKTYTTTQSFPYTGTVTLESIYSLIFDCSRCSTGIVDSSVHIGQFSSWDKSMSGNTVKLTRTTRTNLGSKPVKYMKPIITPGHSISGYETQHETANLTQAFKETVSYTITATLMSE